MRREKRGGGGGRHRIISMKRSRLRAQEEMIALFLQLRQRPLFVKALIGGILNRMLML